MSKQEHIVLVGPMASGKTTICRGIMEELKKQDKVVMRIERSKDYDFLHPRTQDVIDVFIWDGCEPLEGIKPTKTITIEVHDE